MAGTSSRLTNRAKNTPKARESTAGFKNCAPVDCSAIIGINPTKVVTVGRPKPLEVDGEVAYMASPSLARLALNHIRSAQKSFTTLLDEEETPWARQAASASITPRPPQLPVPPILARERWAAGASVRSRIEGLRNRVERQKRRGVEEDLELVDIEPVVAPVRISRTGSEPVRISRTGSDRAARECPPLPPRVPLRRPPVLRVGVWAEDGSICQVARADAPEGVGAVGQLDGEVE